jgi:cytochrome P450
MATTLISFRQQLRQVMGIKDIDPSGLPGGPSLGTLMELVPRLVNEDPLVVGRYLRDQYGHTVRIPPIHPALDSDVFLLTHPDDLQYVLQTHPRDFGALDVPGSRDFGRVVRNSVVSLHEDSEEGSWSRRTRLLSPEFTEGAVARKVPEIVETTLAAMAEFEGPDGGLSAGDPRTVPDAVRVHAPGHDGVRLMPAMQRLTLRLLGESLFGPDIRAHETGIIEAVDGLRDLFKRRQLHMVTSHVTRHLPEELHLPGWLQEPLGADPYVELTGRQERQIETYVDQLVGAADAIVERRQRTPRAYDDALGTWLCRADPVDGEALDPATLRQEVLGLLIAGHATVTAGLTWSLYLLAARPDVQQRIRDEARGTDLLAPFSDAYCSVALGEGGADTGTGQRFLDGLPYTRRVWQEAIRLYPPLPVFGRTVTADTEVGGQPMAEGSHVLISPYVTHHDPEFWDDPDTFDPSRFDSEAVADRHELAYLPFSVGRHACLGESVATTEATAVLAAICATYDIEFARPEGEDEEFDPHEAPEVGLDSAINLQPDRDIHVRFRPVEPA